MVSHLNKQKKKIAVVFLNSSYDDDNKITAILSYLDLDEVFQTRIIQNHQNCYSSFTTSAYVKQLKKHRHKKKKDAE